jgi:beta-glucanase (GH16 family)
MFNAQLTKTALKVSAALLATAGVALFAASAGPVFASPPSGYYMTWHDEFNGTVGSAPNSTNWGYDTGAGGWGQAELQTYTTSTTNSSIVSDSSAPNGTALAITATYSGGNYNSARLDGLNHGQSFTYGYFESEINHPSGSGLWPCWWMMGTDYPTAGWPNCGELDIFEMFGDAPTTEMWSRWYGTSSDELGGTNDETVASSGYQTYGFLWTSTTMEAYYNGTGFGSISNPGSPFNAPFYFLINMAVGGDPGGVGSGTTFPASFKLGYLRVYEPTSTSSSTSSTSSSSSGSGVGNGTYQLDPQCATGSRLDDAGGYTTNGSKVDLYASNGSSGQKWSFSSTGVSPSGDYNAAVNGAYCLQASGTTSGSATEIWACNGAAAQAWNIVKDSSPSGYYQLNPSTNTALCLDVTGAATTNGTVIDTYTCNQTNAQQWAGL